MNMITFTIAVILIVVYLATSIVLFGVTKSISDTYYQYRKNLPKLQWFFPTTMMLIAMLLFHSWTSVTQGSATQCLAFLSCAGLLFVGGAHAYRSSLTKQVHYWGAGVWAGAALLFFLINKDFVSISFGLAVGLIGLLANKFKNLFFWGEIAGITMLLFGILKLLL